MCSILKSIFVTAIVYSYLPDVPLKIYFLSIAVSPCSLCVHLPRDLQFFHPWTKVWLRAEGVLLE